MDGWMCVIVNRTKLNIDNNNMEPTGVHNEIASIVRPNKQQTRRRIVRKKKKKKKKEKKNSSNNNWQ